MLRDLEIKPDNISTKEAKSKLAHSPPSKEPQSPSKFEDAPEIMTGEGLKRKKNTQSVPFSENDKNPISKSHHAKKAKSDHSNYKPAVNKLGPPPGKRPHILHLYP